ncbi:MAG: UDPGP type 1 family protein [Proteobacteria bacterium]|nr:UDPGP type 1 family protein [Pseudomonadota bacterium]
MFRFWDELDAAGRDRLLAQAAAIDLERLLPAARTAIDTLREAKAPELAPPDDVLELPEHGGDPGGWKAATERGRELLAAGRVGVMVVAGGQGTRLGFEGPKGAFPVGPLSSRTLFALQAEKIRGLRRRGGVAVPWYVMTSPATDAATREIFAREKQFGLPESDVFLFSQDTTPALDFEGRLLLEQRDRIFESPNGHGGAITALAASGALDDMERRGIDTLFYYQVDNPLAPIGDAAFWGHHDRTGAEVSCKVGRKTDPMAKWGLLARCDGRTGVVEYTEISDEHRYATDAAGELVYWAGNLAIHVFATDFLRRMAADADARLPYHASAKKIPYVDRQGHPVAPSEPNGYKLERFVFDALPAANRVSLVEARLPDEFSPIKNAEGVESPETARRDLQAVTRRWLTEAGLELPAPDCGVELDHSRIDGPEEAASFRSLTEAGDVIRTAPGATA